MAHRRTEYVRTRLMTRLRPDDEGTNSEIGVALTTFGGLFMLLGVMLFFDGALLALGNVRLPPSLPAFILTAPN